MLKCDSIKTENTVGYYFYNRDPIIRTNDFTFMQAPIRIIEQRIFDL